MHARSSVDLPPSLRTTATGVAAWARMTALWWPLSILAGVSALGAVDGEAGALLPSLVGLAVAALVFVALATLEARRAARFGIGQLAAGSLVATAGAATGGLVVAFLIFGLAAG